MKNQEQSQENNWPPRPDVFAELLTPIEAAQYLRLDETGKAVRKLLRNTGRRYLGISGGSKRLNPSDCMIIFHFAMYECETRNGG